MKALAQIRYTYTHENISSYIWKPILTNQIQTCKHILTNHMPTNQLMLRLIHESTNGIESDKYIRVLVHEPRAHPLEYAQIHTWKHMLTNHMLTNHMLRFLHESTNGIESDIYIRALAHEPRAQESHAQIPTWKHTRIQIHACKHTLRIVRTGSSHE